MYIQRNEIRNKKTGKMYSSVFLCHKYREGKKVKTKTLANLSHLPELALLSLENTLKSEKEATVLLKDISVNSCIDYGYVAVLLNIMKTLRIDEVLEKTLSEEDALWVKAMIIGKIITGGSKLCIYNWLLREEGICKLLGVKMTRSKVDKLYYSLGQLSLHQSKIEKKWFRYHQGACRRVYLYDLTSTYFEGTKNFFAAHGYNRDGKRGKLQMCIGLLTDENGFPLRIQAFAGNTSDSTTVAGQIRSLKDELGVEEIIFVGDRGMHITYNLENDPELAETEIDFITGLTHANIQTLIERGTLQLSLFSSDLGEVTVDDRRYILSVNPDLQEKELAFLDHSLKRCDAMIEEIRKSWKKRCEKNLQNIQKKQDKNGKRKNKNLKTELTDKDIRGYIRRVETAVKKCKMNKYYSVEQIDNELFTLTFKSDEFENSRSLCGKYVVYTNVDALAMTAAEVRGEYKKLQNVEHAFRDLKGDNICLRPVHHCKENQTRGHVLLCMFAYAIIKSLEDKFFPFLKEYNQKNKTQLAFHDLTAELNNIKMCELEIGKGITSIKYPKLNPLQIELFKLLNFNPEKMT